MQTSFSPLSTISQGCRLMRATAVFGLLLVLGFAQTVFAQAGTNQLNFFKNYFVTGDYVVAGWVETSSDGVYATGTISVPDLRQPSQNGVPATVPKGADIVAAYLYWATVEKSMTAFAGQQGFFNGFAITGTVLGNPNAPTSWSSGGCSGSSNGATTMRTYRADVRPYLPLDTDSTSPTFGASLANGIFSVRLADSGSNGNTAPNALGATLVIIYRVLSAKEPPVPLNGIVIYDGAYAPSNAALNTSQTLVGFDQPATTPVAKLTHIVANGQPNKSQQVYFKSPSQPLPQPLPSLYGTLPPFPGIYGSWDNPTWVLSQFGYVHTADTSETTSVVPSASNSGCVSWGATILSTTVQDSDGDGLLDVWEDNDGYTDAASGQWVSLPGANPNEKDIFVEVDYLTKLDGSADQHSHLPKQAALDAMGNAFADKSIRVHFDLGAGIYPGDQFLISSGTGGNAIPEGLVLCTDGITLCAFPGQPAVAWKGGFEFIKNEPTLGNFQPGRRQSYHYLLFGHSLGASRSYWSTAGFRLSNSAIPQLASIVNSGTTATVTIKSPQGVLKPGDCPNATIPECSDPNNSRVTIAGALGQSALNGTFFFNNVASTTDVNNISTTTFTITTANVANGTYNFNNEPQLAVAYLGPTSTSGHSDFGGGGDSVVTLGLWGADNLPNCQPDPSQGLSLGQAYCDNQMGSVQTQTGTLFHELGHALTLTHGGTYYTDPDNPFLPTYEPNCKSNFLSVMNYLFQVRGFPDGGIDFSGQKLPNLNESLLNESSGIGSAVLPHYTRWYARPNALDLKLGSFAKSHCDGTRITDGAQMVRVDGTSFTQIDWNNNKVVPDPIEPVAWQDVDFNGSTSILPDPPFQGFDDWAAFDLRQIGARASAFGLSSGGVKFVSGGVKFVSGGVDNDGGGVKFVSGGVKFVSGGVKFVSGGVEQDEVAASSTASPPTGLTAVMSGHNVVLNWTAPAFGQFRRYDIWRATGSFLTLASVLANLSSFSNCPTCTVTGTPPLTTFTDTNVKNNTTYTYFVSDKNKQGVQSGGSAPTTIKVKF